MQSGWHKSQITSDADLVKHKTRFTVNLKKVKKVKKKRCFNQKIFGLLCFQNGEQATAYFMVQHWRIWSYVHACPKDKLTTFQSRCVKYEVNCLRYGFVYYGQTDRGIATRIKENRSAVHVSDSNSKIPQQSWIRHWYLA